MIGGGPLFTRGPWQSANVLPDPHGQGSCGSIFAIDALRLTTDELGKVRIDIAAQIGYRQLHPFKDDQ